MAAASQADVRKQIAAGKVAPIYLLLGADEAAKIALAGEFLELVETDLRAFNVDRLYGGETTGAEVVDAARTLPMMVPRRVVLLLHAERLLNPKKDSEAERAEISRRSKSYVKAPVDTCCLVIVAEAVDKRRSLTKQLLSKATVVECTRAGRRCRSGEMGEGSRREGRDDDRRPRRAARGRSRRARCVAASRRTSSGWCSTPQGTRRLPKPT